MDMIKEKRGANNQNEGVDGTSPDQINLQELIKRKMTEGLKQKVVRQKPKQTKDNLH